MKERKTYREGRTTFAYSSFLKALFDLVSLSKIKVITTTIWTQGNTPQGANKNKISQQRKALENVSKTKS